MKEERKSRREATADATARLSLSLPPAHAWPPPLPAVVAGRLVVRLHQLQQPVNRFLRQIQL
jgi:hypothetical protein